MGKLTDKCAEGVKVGPLVKELTQDAINLFEMKRFEEALDSYEALLALEIDADRRQQVTQIVNQLRTALGKD